MNSTIAGPATEPRPAFWYGLPDGYVRLSLHPSLERVENLAAQVRALPDAVRERAESAFRFYAGILTLFNDQEVQGCAIGLHPDGEGGISFSVLTVSTVPVTGVDPKLVLAGLLGTSGERPPGETLTPVELPCGLGFLSETERRTTAPGRPPEGADGPPQGTVWQGTVALTGAGTPDIIVVQLVTAAVELAADYRDVLLGTAATLTFSDPAHPEGREEEDPPGWAPAGGTVRDIFG
ncbi:hypothetical protein [Streptomyces chrestomyceticus]|uniref:hypothetical protein n=1 Tax=Streptomyces chrestomyceticus TaxID=68185 RepID=UPI0004C5AC01